MRLVMDANVFAAFFRSAVGRPLGDVTADPIPLFAFDSQYGRLVLDKGGIIEHEWRATVDREWCDAWLGDALIADFITHEEARAEARLTKLLTEHGFPIANSRDIWYLRLVDSLEDVGFVTEDLDFYQPDKKGDIRGQDRLDFLSKGKGKLRKALRRERGIDLACISRWLAPA